MRRVVIVEDSLVMGRAFKRIVEAADGFEVVGEAADGMTALDVVRELRPDLLLLDLQLPRLSGLSVIRRLMATQPLPIVVLSGRLDQPGVGSAFDALEAGAVHVIPKPTAAGGIRSQGFIDLLVEELRAVVPVDSTRIALPVGLSTAPRGAPQGLEDRDILLIGSSTGGPQILIQLLQQLKPPARVPIIVCQHLLQGFDAAMARWLSSSGHDVQLATDGEIIRPGAVRLAPASADISIDFRQLRVIPFDPESVRLCSADLLFSSGSELWNPVCAVLSGMGRDGAKGLATAVARGACAVVQAPAQSAVSSMPLAALEAAPGAAVLAPGQLAAALGDAFGARE